MASNRNTNGRDFKKFFMEIMESKNNKQKTLSLFAKKPPKATRSSRVSLANFALLRFLVFRKTKKKALP